MSAPEVVLVNSSTVRVLWLPPLRPNGAVTAYRVFLNGLLRGSVDGGSGSFLLGDLLPLTVYDVQVRAGKTFRCSIPSHKRVIVCFVVRALLRVSGGGVHCVRMRAQQRDSDDHGGGPSCRHRCAARAGSLFQVTQRCSASVFFNFRIISSSFFQFSA